MSSPSSSAQASWIPLSFPAAQVIAPPDPHALFETLKAPRADSGQFYSAKGVKRLQGAAEEQGHTLDFAALEARSERAWDERRPAFSTKVVKESLNFLGRAFGGNIVEWHMRGALAAASELRPDSHLYLTRVARGAVTFLAPLFADDEVRIFAEPLGPASGDLLRTAPFTKTFRMSLVVRRQRGFADAPLSIMELGSSEIEVLHMPAPRDHFSKHETLRGFNISSVIRNDFELCQAHNFKYTPLKEGLLRRASQLAAAADVRFYVIAREILGGDRLREPILTRDISLNLSERAYEQILVDHPVSFDVRETAEIKRVSGNKILKLTGALRVEEREIASTSATMVQINQ